ncbi:MAG: helicase-related protein, partial [Spirochaeta sp.]|nr:helicase-related protein [Spirochaeta sp.]
HRDTWGRDTSWKWFTNADLEDLEDAPDDELSEAEEQATLHATTAATIEELKEEIKTLHNLETLARAVLRSGDDRKWKELSRLIQDNEYMFDRNGARRKLVIFTEHKDTLTYLKEQITRLFGSSASIVTISGGMGREHRKVAEAQFKQDQSVEILIATDAAGEGINLQRAHLMINYDLPWNPNRLEQRFGRIHRIGQTEICHLWNLVAHETREGQVFQRLLSKLEVENEALSGRVFDVLGTVFEGTSLRDLLIEAIRSDSTNTDANTVRTIETTMDHERLKELLETRALALETLDSTKVQRIRERMERARLERLQPFYIESFFQEAFMHLGGTMRLREQARWQIRHIPVELRRRDRVIGIGTPLLSSYERITFHHDHIEGSHGRVADFVSPGHPLLDTVVDQILERYRELLRRGTILVDRREETTTTTRALVVLEHSIREGFSTEKTPQRVASRQLVTVWIDPDGTVEPAGTVPWLDLDVPAEDEKDVVRTIIDDSWSSTNIESDAISYVAQRVAPEHFLDLETRRVEQVEKTRREVMSRLSKEIAFWDHRAEDLRLAEQAGKVHRNLNSENARRRSEELHARLAERLRDLDNQKVLSSQAPVLRSVSIVVPTALLQMNNNQESETGTPPPLSVDPVARKRIEEVAMEAVAATERDHGFEPHDVSRENRGYDIESRTPDGALRFIEVKGRAAGATEITVTHNEMKYGFNKPDNYYLAIVLVGEDDTVDGPHYVRNPFDRAPMLVETENRIAIEKIINRES